MQPDRAGERAARAVYFTIVALAVIVALEEAGDGVLPREVVASTVGATVITALAELYGRYIGDAIRTKHLPTRAELRASAADSAVGVLAALVTVVPFVAAAAGAIGDQTAYDVASWLGLGVLAGYTLFANRTAGLTGMRGLLVGACVVTLGLSLIGLKALVH